MFGIKDHNLHEAPGQVTVGGGGGVDAAIPSCKNEFHGSLALLDQPTNFGSIRVPACV